MTERLEEELAYDSRVLRSSKSARLDRTGRINAKVC